MTRQQSDEHRKRQIRDAATRCFVRRGFSATRLLDIAREAGLSKGGVYFYYRAKEQLFHDILETHLEALHHRWSCAPMSDAPADRTLSRLVVAHLRTMEEDPDETRLFHLLVTMAAQDPVFRDKLEQVFSIMGKLYTTVIERGMQEGIFAAGDAKVMAECVLSMLNGLGCHAAVHPRGELPVSAEEAAGQALRMLRIGSETTASDLEFGEESSAASAKVPLKN